MIVGMMKTAMIATVAYERRGVRAATAAATLPSSAHMSRPVGEDRRKAGGLPADALEDVGCREDAARRAG